MLCLPAAMIVVLMPALAFAGRLRSGDFVMVTWGSGVAPCCRVVTLDATSLAVSEIASDGYLVDPSDIAVDGHGDILVTTPVSGIVRIEPASGAQTIFASPASLGGGAPAGILVTAGGDIYVSMQTTQPRVLQLTAEGLVARVVSSGGLLQDPAGIAFGPDGALYVCETITVGALSGGGLVRVNPGSGAQTLIATGAPLYGPFDIAFAPDGFLWSIQRGILHAGRQGCVVRTRPSDGFSEAVGFGSCRAHGIAIRSDGLTVIADCMPVHGDCYYSYTQVYPAGPSASSPVAGPLAVVPDFVTPTSRRSWGRVKAIYR